MATKYRIVWTDTALADLEAILEYISLNDSVDSAVYVHDNLLSKIEGLTDHPHRCRTVPELNELGVHEFRELLWTSYRVCFSVHSNQLVIVSVLDGRRDLGQLLVDRTLRMK